MESGVNTITHPCICFISGPDKDSDDRVKVRVTRVNRKDLQQKTQDNKQSSEIDNVEMQLKDELEKAGLDLAGAYFFKTDSQIFKMVSLSNLYLAILFRERLFNLKGGGYGFFLKKYSDSQCC